MLNCRCLIALIPAQCLSDLPKTFESVKENERKVWNKLGPQKKIGILNKFHIIVFQKKSSYLTRTKLKIFYYWFFESNYCHFTVKLHTMLESKTAMQILPQNFTVDITEQITEGYRLNFKKKTKGRIAQTNTITMRVASTAYNYITWRLTWNKSEIVAALLVWQETIISKWSYIVGVIF